jgi:hypothetical protein
MISFKCKPKEEPILTLSEVETNQFFIDIEGNLCQKMAHWDYNIIATKDGTPHCDTVRRCEIDANIRAVLAPVSRIDWS